jgi:hypothetical protein
MIVALDLEGNCEAVSNVDQTGILFPCTHQQSSPTPGEGLNNRDRVLITAMLAPHNAINTEFGVCRCPTKDSENPLVFIWREPMTVGQVGSYKRFIN